MEKVVLFGTGPIGRMVYSYLTDGSPHEVVAFTADRDYITEDTLFGLPVVPFEDLESIYPPEDEYRVLVAVGYRRVNRFKAEKYEQAKAKGYQMLTYIRPRAIVSRDVVMGDNCIIEESVIQPFVRIGNNVTIGSGCVIGHNTVIGDHCFVAAATLILGQVTVGPYSFIGGNATIRDRISVGRECIIGAGATILEDTRERGVYLSTPSRPSSVSSNELPFG